MAQSERAIKEFMDGYEKLIKKTNVDFLAVPQWFPDNNGGWQLKISVQPVYTKKDEESFVVDEHTKKN
jgi:lauroyl/myristoyl acyltransferase